MSKVRSPREKKLLCLLHDRRNVYGENDKSSRKNIPLSKQRKRQELRREANAKLRMAAHLSEDQAAAVEQQVKDVIGRRKRNLFRKRPDASLGFVLEHKHGGDWKGLVQPWSKP